ncbi:hypothetical protein U1Q18_038761 [Sarracenia purpurea var. burkii]
MEQSMSSFETVVTLFAVTIVAILSAIASAQYFTMALAPSVDTGSAFSSSIPGAIVGGEPDRARKEPTATLAVATKEEEDGEGTTSSTRLANALENKIFVEATVDLDSVRRDDDSGDYLAFFIGQRQ